MYLRNKIPFCLSILMIVMILAPMIQAAESTFQPPVCLKPTGKGKASGAAFFFPSDGDIGKIIYQKGSGAISVKRIAEKALGTGDHGVPVMGTWDELPETPKSGKYFIATEGVNLTSFRYESSSGKSVKFVEDPEGRSETDDNRCAWMK